MAGSDFSKLTAAMDALVAQVTNTEGVEASAIAAINGQGAATAKAVADALAADDAADAGSITAATAAVNDTTARFVASAAKLGAAIGTNPGPGPIA